MTKRVLEEEQDLARMGGVDGTHAARTWLAPTEYNLWVQRLVIALARWNSRMVLSGLAAIHGVRVAREALMSHTFTVSLPGVV